MGTKTTTKTTTKTKTAAPAKRAATSKPAAEKVATPEPSRAQPKAAVPKQKPALRRTKKPSYSEEDIALRAYFIAERRQAAELPGDSHQDWIEAERQLAAEASTSGRPKVAQS